MRLTCGDCGGDVGANKVDSVAIKSWEDSPVFTERELSCSHCGAFPDDVPSILYLPRCLVEVRPPEVGDVTRTISEPELVTVRHSKSQAVT